MTINAVQAIELVGSLYEAALDAALWPEVLGRCAQALDADCGVLFVHDFADASAQVNGDCGALTANWGFEPAAIASYAAHYSMLNVWAENELTLAEGQAVSSSMLFPDQKLPHTEFGCDWLRPQRLFYALGGVLQRRGSQASKVSFLRSSQAGAYCTKELAFWQTLMRHLQRAIELHQQARALDMRSEDCLAALDLVPQGIVLLSANGEVKHISRTARSLLTAQRGLYVDRASILRAASSAQDTQMQRLIRSALQLTLPSAGGGALRIQGSQGPLHLFVTPLPTRSEHFGLTHAAAAVFITDPQARPLGLPQLLRTLYGMTPAEARLTAELVAGRTLREYAEQSALSLNTARTQLKSAATKADVKRQADLVRVVLTGPAVLRAHDE